MPRQPTVLASIANRGHWVEGILFFLLFFGFVWRLVDPRLIYHGGGEIQFFPSFYWGSEFRQEFLRQPGGPARYLSAFLSQFLYVGWLGALVLTVQAGLMAWCAGRMIRAFGAERLRWVRFAPPLLLLVLHSWYTYCLPAVTDLLLGLGLACAYLEWRPANAWVRVGLMVAGSGLLYAVAGVASLVFSLVTAALEFQQGCWRVALPGAVWAGLLPAGAGGLFYGLGPAEAWRGLLPFVWKMDTSQYRSMALLSGLFLLLPALGCGLALWRQMGQRLATMKTRFLASKRAESPPGSKRKSARRPSTRLGASDGRAFESARTVERSARGFGWLIETCCVFLAAGAAMVWCPDKGLKALLSVDYYAYNRMWSQVLEAARGNPTNIYVVHAVNRALYHTGRLGYELPLFQPPEHLLLSGQDLRAHWSRIDLYLDLGCVNLALHHLSEALTVYGERPCLLRRLALVNLALGNTGTARIYLRALARTLFHADWARDYLRRLELDPAAAQDSEVARLRRLAPAQDDLVPLPAKTLLERLIEANGENRMAWEYLVSYCLLTKDLPALARNMRRLATLGWKEYPPLYEEALVLAAKQSGIDPAALVPPASLEARQRFERYAEAARTSGPDPRAWSHPLAREFAASYFFYYFTRP